MDLNRSHSKWVMFHGEPIVNQPKSAARKSKTRKSNARSLKVRTKVRAGKVTMNRCEALQRRI
jgi:hypothetical protein